MLSDGTKSYFYVWENQQAIFRPSKHPHPQSWFSCVWSRGPEAFKGPEAVRIDCGDPQPYFLAVTGISSLKIIKLILKGWRKNKRSWKFCFLGPCKQMHWERTWLSFAVLLPRRVWKLQPVWLQERALQPGLIVSTSCSRLAFLKSCSLLLMVVHVRRVGVGGMSEAGHCLTSGCANLATTWWHHNFSPWIPSPGDCLQSETEVKRFSPAGKQMGQKVKENF